MTAPRGGDLPGLAAWMEHGLYDAEAGYYAAGRVRFGHKADFWTFPTRLSPAFGTLLAQHLAGLRQRLVDGGALAATAPFQVVELGAGDGTLSRDLLDAVARMAEVGPAFAGLAATLLIRVGERAPALQLRQRDAAGTWARATLPGHPDLLRFDHLRQTAADLLPAIEPFVGVVLHNELLDVWPHELLLPGPVADDPPRRLTLAATPPGAGAPLAAPELVGAMRAAFAAGEAAGTPSITTSDAPLATEADADGASIRAWLAALAPWLAHRRAASAEPPALLVCPGIPALTRWAAHALQAGWMLTIDYGAGVDHQLDPAPALAQLRLFPEPEAPPRFAPARAALVDLGWPGRQDVTVDIDFSHLAWSGAAHDLVPVAHGPQGLLARGSVLAAALGTVTLDLLARDVRSEIETTMIRRARQAHQPVPGPVAAAQLVFSAARGLASGSAGFRLLLQERAGTPGGLQPMLPVGSDERLAAGLWPVLPAELPALALAARGAEGRARLAALFPDWRPEALARLRPAASLLAVLDEIGARAEVAAIVAKLRDAGLLAHPGAEVP